MFQVLSNLHVHILLYFKSMKTIKIFTRCKKIVINSDIFVMIYRGTKSQYLTALTLVLSIAHELADREQNKSITM